MNWGPAHVDEDDRFDRLVDGELSPEQYGQLLRSLDQDPHGWRKCALAFLQAQALQQELQAMAEGHLVQEATGAHVRPRSPWLSGWARSLLLAASILIAFGLGLAVRSFWSLPGSVDVATQPTTDDREPASKEEGGPWLDRDGSATDAGPEPERGLPPRRLTLLLNSDDGAAPLELPVYEMDPVRATWLWQEQSAMPRQVRRALQRMGREVKRNQFLAPVFLEDGRPVLIPVEQLEVTPVRERVFQ